MIICGDKETQSGKNLRTKRVVCLVVLFHRLATGSTFAESTGKWKKCEKAIRGLPISKESQAILKKGE